MKWADIWDTI